MPINATLPYVFKLNLDTTAIGETVTANTCNYKIQITSRGFGFSQVNIYKDSISSLKTNVILPDPSFTECVLAKCSNSSPDSTLLTKKSFYECLQRIIVEESKINSRFLQFQTPNVGVDVFVRRLTDLFTLDGYDVKQRDIRIRDILPLFKSIAEQFIIAGRQTVDDNPTDPTSGTLAMSLNTGDKIKLIVNMSSVINLDASSSLAGDDNTDSHTGATISNVGVTDGSNVVTDLKNIIIHIEIVSL